MKNSILIALFTLSSLSTFAQFGSPEIIDSTITYTVMDMVTADLNNDGKKDIITCHYQDQVNWYLNSGGMFSSEQVISNNISHPLHLETGDANSDGNIDILVTDDNNNNSKVVLFFNNNNGTIWNQVVIDSAIQVAAIRSYFTDVDNDGDLDIITCTDLQITMYLNSGSGSFSNRIVIADTNEFYNLIVSDFNNDTFEDFAVHSGHGLQIYFNNTNTTFYLASTITSDLNLFLTSFDIDNDNHMDIITAANSAIDYTSYKNDGLGIFSFFETSAFYCGDNINAAFVNESINADNLKDVVYIPTSNSNIFWKSNNGNGNLINPTLIDSSFHYWNLITDDIDNDFDKDIIWFGTKNGIPNLGLIKNNNTALSIDQSSHLSINISPNPACETVKITSNTGLSSTTFFNSLGQHILSTCNENINVSAFKNGIYFVKITTPDNQIKCIKLIKSDIEKQ